MKKVFFVSVFTLITFFSMAQNIGDVKRTDDGMTLVYDTANRYIATGYTGDKTYNWDYSACMIVIRGKEHNWTMVYDEQLHLIASGHCGEVGYTFKVVGCKVVIKSKEGYKMIYDKTLHLIESGW
jgi:hypothetical protein